MPLVVLEGAVPPDWADAGGRMRAAAACLAFAEASELALERLGLGVAYRAATGCLAEPAEARYRYRAALARGDAYRVLAWLDGADARRLALSHRMVSAGGRLAAEAEILLRHTERGGDRALPFPPEIRARLTRLAPSQAIRSFAA
ncbi:hypothetical protein LNKW23_09740 [Paralimibaculum aggregatum]|uniref:Thioesterase n=1 Tax=Paralimibaculum aggregatum TaxID=3036245 RepID=A0ABQ6LH57_9RHOB|nr:thioesterase family protein [Limibaculum sp. NKW23]GMG81761.1 hypothetical protein LNKW23_09740 [Limibaculum sp. NKW23]